MMSTMSSDVEVNLQFDDPRLHVACCNSVVVVVLVEVCLQFGRVRVTKVMGEAGFIQSTMDGRKVPPCYRDPTMGNIEYEIWSRCTGLGPRIVGETRSAHVFLIA